ncbi:nuclear transport factor 2 family protein [Paenibacillus sp. FSL F4-0087]|uniref:Nuclear transport factor 2 family protein n=1 Tax=Paenibacillus taichungensis TaxID=484184 RepID=A0ABX2MQH5_9BACL|nr:MULTISPECIES: nuclear transport factor 2 family protein [Paenibacillus]MDR9746101.1 nuclear transport factor 2 family protein [Paenibacillus taichungensis]NUU56248.1 nuclear transport factor 2 family protein [Paenibacillus taichungensis]OME83749.1 hypothetical protein BK122_10075 [Paenibacillus pabuli]PIH55897.1 nuclear transport factor 2 family protein [Paenibacillus sp. LK1]
MDLNHLPSVIGKYITASNKPDPAVFVDCFSENAVVLDEGKKRNGKQAIREWSDQYHFAANVTLEPTTAKKMGEEIVLTCKLDGTYDKTGLPDPLLLNYHFVIVDDQIVSLSIF